MAERFLDILIKKYPNGNEKLKEEIEKLKQKLISNDEENKTDKTQKRKSDLNEFSDCDEDLLCSIADNVEAKISSSNSPQSVETKKFSCEMCGKLYKYKNSKDRHEQTHKMKFKCTLCGKCYSRKSNLKIHKNNCGKTSQNCSKIFYNCRHCEMQFPAYEVLADHVENIHPLSNYQIGGNQSVTNNKATPLTAPACNIKKGEQHKNEIKNRKSNSKSALNGSAFEIKLFPSEYEQYDLLNFFSNAKENIMHHLTEKKHTLKNIKWYLSTQVEIVRDLENGEQDSISPHFRSKTYTSLLNETDEHDVNEAFMKINEAMENFIRKGSNWRLKKVIVLTLSIVKYSPLAASSYMELPSKLYNSKSIINIQNDDQKCFLWSILAALHPVSNNAHRIHYYKNFDNELNMQGIEYPVSITQMEKFEKQNINISVNVFGYEDDEIYPLYLSKQTDVQHEVDLLYLKSENNSHYCLIKNLNRFLHFLKSNIHCTYHYCRRCLQGFTRFNLLQEHYDYCKNIDFQRVTFPEAGKNDILEFKDHHKQIKVGFTIYADFECLSQKLQPSDSDTNTSITREAMFVASGYAFKLVCSNDKYSRAPIVYRGENAVEHFLDRIMETEDYIKDILSNPEPLVMNKQTEKQFQEAKQCFVCQKLFGNENLKVRDHEHLGYNEDINSPSYSNYRGAACQSCNLKLKQPNFIPVVLHNGKNFDYKLLCQAIGKYKERKISVIAQNMERFISFSIGNFRFIDSFQFMSVSLEKLVENLSEEGLGHFKHFQQEFPSDNVAQYILRKNVYCYDYMDSFEKFSEQQLPKKDAFYNRITKSDISDDDYNHVKTVFKMFNMKNLGDLHDFYVLTDTLLLCDVFEKFRNLTLDYYGLDACHFYTAPGLSWAAMLKMTNISLELLTDPTMYNMFELSTRGGISMICKRFSKANNPYLPGTYNPNKPHSFLLYLDASNLYGFAMQQKLPSGLMRWLSEEEIENFDLNQIPNDGEKGYYLEVDIEYPESLHDAHNCYPLMPSHKVVHEDELSNFTKQLRKKLYGDKSRMPKTKKLIPTLENKSNYILHYKNLKLYQELGLKITKIHKVLEFHQSSWLKKYIDFNTSKRKEAKNEFEKDFFKLMCNAIFGKTMEDLRKRVDIKLIQCNKKLAKYVSKPSFHRFKIINEDLVAVENKKINLFLCKPCYVGATVLEYSKAHMYDFHYNVMKKRYGKNIKLCFTDTDSLLYEIITHDVYQDLMEIKHLFDFSNYGKEHPLFHNDNKKVPGTFKDETAGKPISEFVGLKPKMYSFCFGTKNEEKRTAKGITYSVINKELCHEDYKKCLLEESQTKCEMTIIASDRHKLYLNTVNKTALSCYDDKRYVTKNCHETLSYGHFSLKNNS